MSFKYGVLGAGRQGTAAAYDIARFGDAISIQIADSSLQIATQSAERINNLIGHNLVIPRQIDACSQTQLLEFMQDLDGCISALPYYLNFTAAQSAVSAKCHFCDLGGNTDIVIKELTLNSDAQKAEVSIVPDCGVGPGLISNLAVYAIEKFDKAEDIFIYDGGLPQQPTPPFNYKLFFNVEGLTNEYVGDALYIVNGEMTPTVCFDPIEYEVIDIPVLGKLEAFTTSGALSTLTSTYKGKLKNLKNKTLRYVGHYQLFKGLSDLGMLSLDPIKVGEAMIAPRHFLHKFIEKQFAPLPDEKDYMAIHIIAHGISNGRPAKFVLDLLDGYNAQTRFSAMERTTGFHAAIVLQMAVRNEISLGAISLEQAVKASRMVEEIARRDMKIKEHFSYV